MSTAQFMALVRVQFPQIMGCSPTQFESGRLFALIGFVPGALGEYLNSLRRELVPSSPFKSHVTVLPPRMLEGCASDLSQLLRRRLLSIHAFEIGLGKVEVFPGSGVIYLGIEAGSTALLETHRMLARDEFAYEEPYSFHPHVTLAQGFPLDQAEELAERARRLWKSWHGERSFELNQINFVKGADLCTWESVSEYQLNHRRRRKTV